jgi:hypothetical protein
LRILLVQLRIALPDDEGPIIFRHFVLPDAERPFSIPALCTAAAALFRHFAAASGQNSYDLGALQCPNAESHPVYGTWHCPMPKVILFTALCSNTVDFWMLFVQLHLLPKTPKPQIVLKYLIK